MIEGKRRTKGEKKGGGKTERKKEGVTNWEREKKGKRSPQPKFLATPRFAQNNQGPQRGFKGPDPPASNRTIHEIRINPIFWMDVEEGGKL